MLASLFDRILQLLGTTHEAVRIALLPETGITRVYCIMLHHTLVRDARQARSHCHIKVISQDMRCEDTQLDTSLDAVVTDLVEDAAPMHAIGAARLDCLTQGLLQVHTRRM